MDLAAESSGEFLVGEALAERIRCIAGGGGVRCAVAFWTSVGVSTIFPEGLSDDAQIVCDISMGSTSAAALEALGAPHSPRLRHSDRMHAKVFISDRGLVVGSANVSASALGAGGRALDNVEVGSFHPAKSSQWITAATWFENLVSVSRKVGRAEVEWAKFVYREKPPVVRPRKIKAGSLLDLVAAAPWRFHDIGFVFCDVPLNEDEKATVRREAKAIAGTNSEHIDHLRDDNSFCNWRIDEIRRWPDYFFLFWQPNNALRVSAHRIEIRIPRIGSLMTSRNLHGLRRMCHVALPSLNAVNQADGERARRLRDDHGTVLHANGIELAARLDAI